MRCALVDCNTREVLNFIEADPEKDAAPAGCELLSGAPSAARIGWKHDFEAGFCRLLPADERAIREKAEEDAKPANAARRMIADNPEKFLRMLERQDEKSD